jgi:replicative DNA helicase
VNYEPHNHLLPSTELSEMAIVSILMNAPEGWDDCSRLEPHHFITDWLRSTFVEMKAQYAKKGTYDLITLSEGLKDIADIKELNELMQYHGHSRRAIHIHVTKLVDAFKSRQLYQMSGMLHDLAFETTPIQERVDQVSVELLKLEDKEDFGEWIDAHESAIKHLELLEQRESGINTGMETGITDLDEMLDGGLQRGMMFVIGARPAMGKSALGLTIGLSMAKKYSVGFISMEMSRSDVSDRQAAILGGISIASIKRPSRGLQYDRIVESVEASKRRKFYVVEQGGLNIMQVKAKAKSLKRRNGLDVLIVDYIGLMSGMDGKVSRAYQIEEISRGLKTLAKDLGIVVICLAQVNRAAAGSNTAPGLHELRDSGSIEQDADVVAFIHRPIATNPELGEMWQSYAQLRIAKNRQGRTGDVHLHYIGEQTKFGQWAGVPPTNTVSKRGFE